MHQVKLRLAASIPASAMPGLHKQHVSVCWAPDGSAVLLRCRFKQPSSAAWTDSYQVGLCKALEGQLHGNCTAAVLGSMEVAFKLTDKVSGAGKKPEVAIALQVVHVLEVASSSLALDYNQINHLQSQS